MKKIFHYKLKNKLEVIFEKIKDVNIVAIFFVVKTGSGNEIEGKEGITHFLEHLIFKGSEKFSAKDITEKIESLGGSINGYTSPDETAFYISIPKRNWQKGFDILQSMIFHASFTEEDFKKEKKVILEELKDGKDNPFRLLIDETFSTIFKKHPYKNPVIGYEKSIENISFDDIKKYYKTFYIPKNILLVIVGNLTENEVKNKLSILEKYKNNPAYIKSCKIFEPAQKSFQAKFFHSNVNQFYLNSVFKIKPSNLKEFIGIQLLCSLLGEFEHSFLKERLKIKTQLVTDISSFIYFTKNFLIFNIHCQFSKNINPETVIETLIKELNNFLIEPILPDQLLKAKINFKTDKIYMQESVSGEARNIIFYHLTTGDYKNEEKFDVISDSIDEKELKLIYKKIFKINNCSIIVLGPESYKNIGNFNIYKKLPKYKNEKTNLKKSPQLITLDNGIRIIYQKIDRLPLISFKIAMLGGLKFENENKKGLSNFMSRVWIKGSENYSYKEIENRFDFFSGFIDSFSGRNSVGLHGVILNDFFEAGSDILYDILTNPQFPDSEVEKTRKEILDRIASEKDDIFSESIRFFYKSIFKEHYYGFPIKGEIETVEKISRDDIVNYYKKINLSNNLVFGITGKLKQKHLDFICERFNNIKSGNFPSENEQITLKNKGGIYRKFYKKNQSYITAGFIAPPVNDDDVIKLKIIKTIIGNHSGRLFYNLREKEGLCYSTFAFMMKGFEASAFGIFVSTSAANEETVIKRLKESIYEIKSKPITNKEILKAKNSIKGSIDSYNQKFLNINTSNVFNILYGLGKDYNKIYLQKLNQINREDITDTVNKYFNPENFTFAIISPKE